MSTTIKALFEDVKSADGEAAAVSTERASKARELSALESRERLAQMRQQETRTRLLEALRPERPYRLDDTHIVRKVGGRLVVEELQDPEKESASPTVVTPAHSNETLALLWQGFRMGISRTFIVVVLIGGTVFGAVSLVGYLNGRPDDGRPPAPAPDDKLPELAAKLKRAITSNLDRDRTTTAEAEKIAANFTQVAGEISQAVAGAGHEELKDPAKIETRIKELNQASVDGSRWRSVFAGFAEVAMQLDDASKLSTAGDYVPLFEAAAQALHSFAQGR